MTRRVGEPATERKARQGVWGVEDLRERPAPAPAAASVPGIEWARYESLTDTGAAMTALDWTLDEGKWDVSGLFETFDLSAGSNPLIGKDGVYKLALAWRAGVDNPNVDTVREFEFDVIAGETPGGLFEAWTSARVARWPSRINRTSTSHDVNGLTGWPAMQDYMIFDDDAFAEGTAGACELQVRAAKEEDEAYVGETQWQFFLLIIRLGSEWVDP